MSFQNGIKEYSAERQIKVRHLGGADGVSNADLYLAIQDLRSEIAGLREQRAEQPSPVETIDAGSSLAEKGA
jgi:hypothetical protein